MKIFELENYNNIYISFYSECGFSPSSFNYRINLFCYNKNYELNIHPEEGVFNNEIKKSPINKKKLNVDHSFFEHIYERLKNINFDAFIYDNSEVEDAGSVSFKIKKNKYILEVYYFPFVIQEGRCNKNIIELDNVYKNLLNKINYKEWYSEIKKRYNLGDGISL